MPRIPVFKLRSRGPVSPPPVLAGYLRSDVSLSPKFCEQMRTHLGRLIVRSGGVETVLDEHNPSPVDEKQGREMFVRPVTSASATNPALRANGPASGARSGARALRQEPTEIKRL